jgi:hypothetical protein
MQEARTPPPITPENILGAIRAMPRKFNDLCAYFGVENDRRQKEKLRHAATALMSTDKIVREKTGTTQDDVLSWDDHSGLISIKPTLDRRAKARA